MNPNFTRPFFLLIATVYSAVSFAQPAQLLSNRTPMLPAPDGTGGDSWGPIMTPDGRFVLFASSGRNLVAPGANAPTDAGLVPKINVYRRDRSNGSTVLASVNISGVKGGNGDSVPVGISTNGQYALFESSASDLVPGDTNHSSDIFVRDLVAGTNILVSTSTNGNPGNGVSQAAVMTPDGRYVAFVSAANNLVSDDSNGIPDVFVRDLQMGVTRLASVGALASAAASPGSAYGSSGSDTPRISPDGRFVAFSSTATNLVASVSTVGDIYLRDVIGGVTYWVSSDARNMLFSVVQSTNAICYSPVISDDGLFVAYETTLTSSSIQKGLVLRYNVINGTTDLISTNAAVSSRVSTTLQDLDMTADGSLVAFINTNSGAGTTCLFIWDSESGTSTLASVNATNGVPLLSNCHSPLLDSRGRWVSFVSSAANMVTNPVVGSYHMYLRDFSANSTTLLDGDTNGVGVPLSSFTLPVLSEDGRYVAFEVAGATGSISPYGLYIRDRQTGAVEVLSARDALLPSVSASGRSVVGSSSISKDARYAAFASDADDLVTSDANGRRDVFVQDWMTSSNVLVSVNTNGVSSARASMEPAISGDGGYVAFTSHSDELVTGDTNGLQDVFIRDLQSSSTTLISVRTNGTGSGNSDSYSPLLAGDGRYVVFHSTATDLAPGSYSGGGENLFVRDRQLLTTRALTTLANTIPAVAVTPGSRFVAYAAITPSASYLNVWDAQLAQVVYSNSVSVSFVTISSNGNKVAYATSAGVFGRDLTFNTNFTLAAGTLTTSHPGLRFSSDARWITYVKPVNNTNQVYVYDCRTGTNQLISLAFDSAGPAFGISDSPDITPDGRFVAYRSFASNVVAGDTNNSPDIFLFDRNSGSTLLVSASLSGATSAGSASTYPSFSADGRTLVFQSWASDITTNDFNETEDVFRVSLFPQDTIPAFYVQILSGLGATQKPTLTWPAIPEKNYRVQYKDYVTDPTWQDSSGHVTIIGSQGYFIDATATGVLRCYRVAAY